MSDSVLGDVGSKLSCLGSFWRQVATCWQQDGDQERQDEPIWANIGAAIHTGRRSEMQGADVWVLKND